MSAHLKIAKDQVTLYELSKAANEASSATVDFYNASLTTEEDSTEVFRQLGDSLRILTSATNGVNDTARLIASNSSIDPTLSLNSLVLPDQVLPSQATQPQQHQHHQQQLQHQQQQQQSSSTEQEKPAKKKVEKDPNAPKKPLTVFFAYSAYIRQALREERSSKGLPALSSTEITQEISKKWNELGELEKEKWKEAYNEELETYQRVKEKYLEDKRNGIAPIITGPNPAPVPIPSYLLKDKSKKRDHDGSSEKKDKKKKSKKRKSGIPEGVSTNPGDLSLHV
ncbi:High mobility group protein 1 [Wickerhamomyces ciferrii]|uniref:High mobility group protein 1 n=1 Tax=Wickerhamomyces ciferrii (strain ATCC 14091 / BCRC 22168 / CBS 111 / JCM 3599 / NBRC 0793 / NRRL Y-1031 F-60-10) TaxID=1206466 RepID=K0KE92_WICCF|nr:High mobility group protein 1 [Wickerhamomyces ciferrii]CCH43430.1 High mobility group protein 1 [Wickerhamomyces ciferrii]